MKGIFVIYGTINSGKTHTMWLVLSHLLENGGKLIGQLYHAEELYSYEKLLKSKNSLPDFRAHIEFNGKHIMLLSAGDHLNHYYWGFTQHISWAIENNIDYVVCCCRSRNVENSIYRYLIDKYQGGVLVDDNWYWVERVSNKNNWLLERDETAKQIVQNLINEINSKSNSDNTESLFIETCRRLFELNKLDLSNDNIIIAAQLILSLFGNEIGEQSLLHRVGLTKMRFLDTALPLGSFSGYSADSVSNVSTINAPQMTLLHKVIKPEGYIFLEPLYKEQSLIKRSISIDFNTWYNNKVFVNSDISLSRKELLQFVCDKESDEIKNKLYRTLQLASGIIINNKLAHFSQNPLDVSIQEILYETLESLRIEGITENINEIDLEKLKYASNNLFIQSVSIRNYKLYSEGQNISFKDGFSVLIGDNAKGKTTVLDAIRILLATLLPHQVEGETTKIEHGLNDVFHLNVVNRTINERGHVMYNFPVEISAKSIYSELKRSRESRSKRTTRKINEWIIPLFNRIVKNNENNQERLPLIVYCGVERTRPIEKKKVDSRIQHNRFDGYLDCLNTRSTTTYLKVWLRELQQRAAKNKYARELLESFVNAVCGCLKNERIEDIRYVYSETKSVEGAVDRIDDIVLTKRITEEKTERELLSNMSAGYRVMVGLIADLAYRCIVLNPHLGKDAITGTSGIVLIDEIDMHLHPLWQRHIVSDLMRCFPKIQFIATTHSPFIVQSLKREQVISLNGQKAMHNPMNNNLAINAYYMGVDSDRSIYFKSEEDDAYDFLTLAKKGESAEKIDKLMSEYAMRHSDNPIYVAKLRIEANMLKNELLYKEIMED